MAGQEASVAGRRLRITPAGSGEFRMENAQLAVTVVDSKLRLSGRAGEFDRINLASADRSSFVSVNQTRYRGTIAISVRGGSISVVNELPLEAYLMGVVSREMGRRPEAERAALEAQAIVSRTYALKNRGRFRNEGYDLRAGVSDQAYGGVDAETATGNAAVRSTSGLVITHAGQLISAFFHSTCGGSTAGPEEAFRTVRTTPYLTPVSDRRSGGGYYCDVSPRFRWEVRWDGLQLRDILRRTLPAVLGIEASSVDRLRAVLVHRRGRSGRVAELRVVVGGGEIPVYAPDVRRVFQTPAGGSLGSTVITLESEDGAGDLMGLTVFGSGWGHGVGMCQWGSIGRAREGQDARSIVTTYFPGGRVEAWY